MLSDHFCVIRHSGFVWTPNRHEGALTRRALANTNRRPRNLGTRCANALTSITPPYTHLQSCGLR
jgi:hypothetical protein